MLRFRNIKEPTARTSAFFYSSMAFIFKCAILADTLTILRDRILTAQVCS